MSGSMLNCIVITDRNSVDVQIQAGRFLPGIYFYLLIGDNKTSEVKQMILTK